MISESKYKEVAADLGIEVAVIKALAEVESSGSGFLETGEPKILFESHIFWRELVNKKKDPNKYTKGNEDILYPTWKQGKYGKISEQHSRLARAVQIDREAALKSASWGLFQVMGNNYKVLGYNSLQEFINCAYESEDCHLEMFARFIRANNLLRHLQNKDYNKFFRGYNGPSYLQTKYPQKFQAAYKKFSLK